MISYQGMRSEESKSEGFGQLPVGAYVGEVLDVKIEGMAPDQSLVLYIDVTEGEHKEFYMRKYLAAKENGSQYGDPKFKGTYRLRIPNPDNPNATRPELDISRMNDMIFRFEKNNPSYHWDGDEKKLKGLKVGFSTQEDEYNGNKFTRIARLETIDDVKAGKVHPMSPRKRRDAANSLDPMRIPSSPAPVDLMSGMQVVNTEKLPWD